MTALTRNETHAPLAIAPADPMSMLAHAIDNGVDPDKLDKLMALAERWHEGEAKRSYAAAMADAQRNMPVIVKDRQNTQTNSRYASLEMVQSSIKDVYLAHGLTVSFGDEPVERAGDDRVWVKVVATVRHRDGHGETFFQEAPIDDVGIGGKRNKTGVQGLASTRSYLQRYLLCSIFGVTIADQDRDGNQPSIPINEAQVEELNSLCDAMDDDLATYRALINYYKIERIEQLPASKFRHAKTTVEKKIATKRGGSK